MDTLDMALLVILCIDAMLFTGQYAVNSISGTSTLSYISGNNTTLLTNFYSGNITNPVLNQYELLESLPTSVNPVSVDTGSSTFTDSIASALNWLAQIPGVGFLAKLLGAPVFYLTAIGTPFEFVFLIGAIWLGFTLFLIVKFVLGRT